MNVRCAAWFVGLLAASAGSAAALDKPTAVFVMKSDGSEVRKVAQVEGYFEHGFPRFSHDGKRLVFDATLGQNGPRACFVVNVDGTGLQEICKGRMPAWSPDDKQIAFQTDRSGEIYVQNLDGKGRVKIGAGRSPRWSPDGGRLAYSDRQMLTVTDLVTGEETALFDERQHGIFDGFEWSPDGKRIAVVARHVSGGARHLYLVDAAGNTKEFRPRLRNGMGGFVSFSPDGKQVVYSNAWQLHVVDVDGNAAPRKMPGQEGLNRNPAFSPDGKWIAFVSTREAPKPAPPDGAQAPRTWKLEEIKRHRKGTIVYGLAFTPDGRRLVLGCDPKHHGVQVWNFATGETGDLGGRGIRVKMFPDGRRFVTSWHGTLVHIVDINSGDVLRELDHGARMWVLCVSKDGRRILTGGLDKVMRVWDADTGDQLHAYDKLHSDWITRARFSPDGQEAMTIGHDQLLQVWDVETGKVRLSIQHPAAVWGLEVTPDGRHILTGTGGSLQSSLTVLRIGHGGDNAVRMWDAASGRLVREMRGHTHAVYAIDVSPDGRMAASGSWDGTLRLWDLTSGRQLAQTEPGKGRVPCVAFSPDGKLIATGGGGTRIDGKIVEIPDEQVRLYAVRETTDQSSRVSDP